LALVAGTGESDFSDGDPLSNLTQLVDNPVPFDNLLDLASLSVVLEENSDTMLDLADALSPRDSVSQQGSISHDSEAKVLDPERADAARALFGLKLSALN
jgi:hypothetical protein